MVLYSSIQKKIEFGFRGEKDTGLLRDKPFIARVRTNNKLNTQGIAILVTGIGNRYALSTLHQNYSQSNRRRKGIVYTIALHIKLTKIYHSINPWQYQ